MGRNVELNDETIEQAVADLSDEFAREVGALADVLENWRKPEVARAVVESLLDNDRDRFSALLQANRDVPDADLPPDPYGDLTEKQKLLCYKLLLLAEKFGQPKITGTTETCRLRTDLSPDERRRYLEIALHFRERDELPVLSEGWTRGFSGEGPAIPPGVFLDALKAEGLVNCVSDPTIRTIDTSGVFGRLKDVCGFSL